jgi:Secretion system C-terminal sorting domain
MKKYTLSLIGFFAFAISTLAQFQDENKPMISDTLFFEDWSSGSFATNQWIVNPSDPYILKVTNLEGNPAPSAEFSLYEFITCSITSKEIAGTNKYIELRYDISVSPSSYATFFSSAEIYDGNNWHSMDVVEGNGDSIPWSTRVVNISEYCQNNFKLRFRSVGQDIPSGHLNIDNIIVGSFPLGIAEYQNADFIIKPNPAKSSFDLVLKNLENLNTQIIILDMTGKVVYDEEFIPGTKDYIKKVNINTLSKGIYFCEIKSNEKNLIRKVIIE